MGQGIDCATRITPSLGAAFVNDGMSFVGRYLADQSSWKHLSKQEAIDITDAGLWIISFFEKGATNAQGGAWQGTTDGQFAMQYVSEVEQPAGTTIYATVDFDAQDGDMDAIEAYLRAFDQEIQGYEIGVYGSYAVVSAMYDRGVTTKLAQTYAWSHGQKHPNIVFYQYQNDTTAHGANIDYDETNGDAGGWKYGMAIQAQATISIQDADAIITYLSVEFSKQTDTATKVEIHRLANVIRVAAGQPIT